MATIDEIKKKYLFDAIDESEKQAIAELKKRAPGLLRMINGELKRLNAKAQFEMPSDKALFSDGWHINLKLKTQGKNDKLGDILRGIDGMRRLGVIFKLNDHAIYLERSWRPTSHRGVVVNPLSRK